MGKLLIFIGILLGSLLRSVLTVILFLGSYDANSEALKWALLLAGGASFANTIRLATKTWQEVVAQLD